MSNTEIPNWFGVKLAWVFLKFWCSFQRKFRWLFIFFLLVLKLIEIIRHCIPLNKQVHWDLNWMAKLYSFDESRVGMVVKFAKCTNVSSFFKKKTDVQCDSSLSLVLCVFFFKIWCLYQRFPEYGWWLSIYKVVLAIKIS